MGSKNIVEHFAPCARPARGQQLAPAHRYYRGSSTVPRSVVRIRGMTSSSSLARSGGGWRGSSRCRTAFRCTIPSHGYSPGRRSMRSPMKLPPFHSCWRCLSSPTEGQLRSELLDAPASDLDLLKQEKSCKRSIKGKRLLAGWDEWYLEKVLFGG